MLLSVVTIGSGIASAALSSLRVRRLQRVHVGMRALTFTLEILAAHETAIDIESAD